MSADKHKRAIRVAAWVKRIGDRYECSVLINTHCFPQIHKGTNKDVDWMISHGIIRRVRSPAGRNGRMGEQRRTFLKLVETIA